eukprot:1367-Heterococcus_DN1.PRE.2
MFEVVEGAVIKVSLSGVVGGNLTVITSRPAPDEVRAFYAAQKLADTSTAKEQKLLAKLDARQARALQRRETRAAAAAAVDSATEATRKVRTHSSSGSSTAVAAVGRVPQLLWTAADEEVYQQQYQQQQQYTLPQFDAESALAMDMTAAQLSIYQAAQRRTLEQAQRLEVEQVEAAERARAQAQQEAAALAQQLQQQADAELADKDTDPFAQSLALVHSGSSSTPQSPLQGLPPFGAGFSLTAPLVAVNSWGTE